MKSRASIAGHPLHVMLVVIPAGAFLAALIFDFVYMASGSLIWWEATPALMLVGIVGALIAAVPGLVDLVKVVPRQNALTAGVMHAVLNLIVVALFVWNAWMRWSAGSPPPAGQAHPGFWLTLLGDVVLLVSGFLGWTMTYAYHVAQLEHPDTKDPTPPELVTRPPSRVGTPVEQP